MALAIKRLIKQHQKYVGITKETTISAGRMLTRYRSRIIYQDKLLTKYFDSYQKAQNHKQYMLFKNGQTVKNNNIQSYKKPKRTYENSPFKYINYPISA